jgi:hypothetical protein
LEPDSVGPWIWTQIWIRNPDPDPARQSDPQKYKKIHKFHFLSAGCSLVRAEDFSCRLNVLYESIVKSIAIFFIEKI